MPHQDRLMRPICSLISSLILKTLALLRSVPTRLKIRRTRARHRRELSAMSSQELSDLGIGRGEIVALTK